jgi:drug/metabolite transporter (DMT)-like permease
MHFDKTNFYAILWVLLSTGLFALIFAAAKFADGAVGTFQLLVLRYVGALVTVVALGDVRRLADAATPRGVGAHFLRACCGCSAAAAITWATARMPVADASAFGCLYGVMIVILGRALLGERLRAGHSLAILIAFSGAAVVVLAGGAFQGGVLLWPMAAAFASAVLLALEGVLIRLLSQREAARSVMFFVSLFGILLMSIPAAMEWRAAPVGVMLACVALGPVSVLAQYCTIRGYRMAPLSVVGPVDYSWLLFAALIGWVFFDETPGLGVILGGGLILLAGGLLARARAPG